MTKPSRICATCTSFEPSRLDGYGYCKAAPSVEARARFLAADSACVFDDWRAK